MKALLNIIKNSSDEGVSGGGNSDCGPEKGLERIED